MATATSAAADEVDAAQAEPGDDDAPHDEEDHSEGDAAETGVVSDPEPQSVEPDADAEPAASGTEDKTAGTNDWPTWTVGGELLEDRRDANRGLIDIEAMSVFHLLPAHDADSGTDMVYLDRMLVPRSRPPASSRRCG